MSAFIDSLKDKAKEIYYSYGILPSISLSQAVLESGGGSSGLYRDSNNIFGVKGTGTAGSVQMWTTEYINNKPEKVLADFKAFNNDAESFDDYGSFMGTLPRYKGVRESTDYQTALSHLSTSGYATDPQYTLSLTDIIQQQELYLIDWEVTKTPGAPKSLPKTGGGFLTRPPRETEQLKEDFKIDNHFFNTDPTGTLETVGEWLKSAGFLIVGLIILSFGVLYLFK